MADQDREACGSLLPARLTTITQHANGEHEDVDIKRRGRPVRTSVDNALSLTESARSHANRSRGRASLALVLAMLTLVATLFAPLSMVSTAQEVEQKQPESSWSPPRTVYLEETGHSLDQLFLDLWRNAGGASAFGYPITAEIEQDNGHIVQYLQYARFEYWPEGDADGNTVLLGKLGEELRPVSVQRSTASFTTNGAKRETGSAVESARLARAWLPVTERAVASDTETVRYIDATKHSIRSSFLDFWERSGGDAYLGNPLTEEYILNDVTYQVFERGQLALEANGDPFMKPVGRMLAEKYSLDQEPIAQGDIPTYSEELFVPPPEPTAEPEPDLAGYQPGGGEVWIDINLSTQYMIVYQGEIPILEALVSTGRPEFATPPGSYTINTKVDEQDMEGVIGGESYNVPSVPWVMYFTDVGHAIHGAYWHDNFGSVMSHGCVNLPVDTAEYLYNISEIGMRVEIHE